METTKSPSPRLQLALGTGSFAICFCAWGLISAFAPSFRREFGLSATQTSLLVATPVLLGSLARIPVGLLTDRFGGQAHPHAAVPGVGDRNFAAINSG